MPGHEVDSQDWSWVGDTDDNWVPPPVDTTKPSIARIYDAGLGGKDNYPVDREVLDRMAAIAPEGPSLAHANRGFLVEAVTSMAAAGIRQFLDLGTGIPTSPNVHETVWAIEPDTRLVYVDNDPVVLAHNRALMQGDPRVVVLSQDLRQPDAIMEHPKVRRLLDFSQPVGVLMIAVLHFVDVAAASPIVARYVRDMASGSQLAITAAASDGVDPTVLAQAKAAYAAAPLTFRTRAETEALFDRLDMIRPLEDVYRSPAWVIFGGIGAKP